MHSHSHAGSEGGDTKLTIAVAVNFSLTVVQLVAGLISGSLSLVADALHNLSDAGSILLALIARKIGRKPADEQRTYGYLRAETIATFANTVTLIVIALFLIYEAILRLLQPEPVEGWIVVAAAGVALVVDVGTALLTWSMSHGNMNMRAVFIHNLADALGSLGVMVAGTLILIFGFNGADTIVTFLIAGYLLYECVGLLKSSVQILMDGVPDGVSLTEVAQAVKEIDGVAGIHHLHIRSLSEHQRALECHITTPLESQGEIHNLRERVGDLLRDRFSITHSTIEFEEIGHCTDEDMDLVPVHGG